MEVLEHGAVAGSPPAGPWAVLVHGEPVLGAGVREVDRREDPLDVGPLGSSVALVLEKGGRREWWLLVEHVGGPTATISVAEGDRFSTFDRWLDFHVASAHGETPGPAVTFTADGRLEATSPSATLLAQRSGIDLGPGFAGPAARTAVAKVQHEGVLWYVLARDVDGVPDYLPSISDATTIDEYLLEAQRWWGSEPLVS